MTITENSLLIMGNPLLDLVADVDPEFLQKWGLEANNAILADSSHVPLYTELVKDYKVEYVAGGAAQNSARGAQWMLPPKSTSYFGCVGKDEFAKKMREAAHKDGVNVIYMEDESTPTGTCAVLITDKGKNRSLVANLAAANNFKVAHIEKNWSVVENAKYFYTSGFFLTVSPESILKVGAYASESNKVFIMNLSAPFLCQFFKEPMLKILAHADIVFGNESEALAFAEHNELGTKDIAEIALKIAKWNKSNAARPRTVVITQGADPTIVALEGVVKKFPVIPIKSEEIVDTNGAGDAFVGGYLSQLVLGKPLDSCINAANYLANIVIQRSGASYPETKPVLPTF